MMAGMAALTPWCASVAAGGEAASAAFGAIDGRGTLAGAAVAGAASAAGFAASSAWPGAMSQW
jgi:hypothetical protein